MKRLFSIILALGLLAVLLQYFVVFFTNTHEVKYSIMGKDNSYMIYEDFKRVDDLNYYYFKVKDKAGDLYNFSFVGDFNKQEEIISDIKFYKKGKTKCILPIYLNKKEGQVSCIYDKQQVSYSYLKQADSSVASKFLSKIEKDGYNISLTKASDSFEDVDGYKFYKKNIPDDAIFTMWFYKGFYILKDGKVVKKEFFQKDRYENNLARLIDKFYVFVNTDTGGSDYGELYLYDVKDGGKITVSLNNSISSDTYFNGVYDGKIYYTDMKFKTQYSLDLDSQEIEVVGNKKDGFLRVISGKLERVKASEFLENKFYFDKDPFIMDFDFYKKYDVVDFQEEEDAYYFRSKDNKFYKVFKRDINDPILLFKFDGVSEWKVKEGNLMFVSGDSMYYYDELLGIRKILSNKELIYNYKNICDFTKK